MSNSGKVGVSHKASSPTGGDPFSSVRGALTKALSAPTAGDLWRLRADLLEAGLPQDSKVWPVLGEFEQFLDHLATSTSSREYSELASKLDIGAVGGVALGQVFEPGEAQDLVFRLLTALLSEGLMVLATRQHIQAWEGELAAVHRGAAWYLYEELWHWAEQRKPELPAGKRRRLLDRLFRPVQSPETDGGYKAVLLGRLFQILLISHLLEDIGRLKG